MWTSRRTWDPGSWQERTDRPRVLVEDPDGAILSISQRLLERQGFDVQVCTGPQGMGRRECPMVRGEGCPLAAGADVIYTTLACRTGSGREVVSALRRRYPGTPVVAEITQPEHDELADVLDGCEVVYVPCGQREMAAAITAAVPARPDEAF